MSDLILTRRKLIGGISLLFSAPAIVRASSIMPVKVVGNRNRLLTTDEILQYMDKLINPPMVYYGADLIPGESRYETLVYHNLPYSARTA